MSVRVLVVEDEPLAAQAHAEYVRRLEDFEVVGVAHTAGEAARILREDGPVDLILLDMFLPDGHGLVLLQRLRAAGNLCDVIAVTSARDVDMVRRAVAQGVVLYLLKPFTFPMFRAKLTQYAAYRHEIVAAPAEVLQDEVDRMLGSLRSSVEPPQLPKGLTPDRLHVVAEHLREAAEGLSARELGDLLDSSRVTARRYLEHLHETGFASRQSRYAGAGRPEVEYAWRS